MVRFLILAFGVLYSGLLVSMVLFCGYWFVFGGFSSIELPDNPLIWFLIFLLWGVGFSFLVVLPVSLLYEYARERWPSLKIWDLWT